MLISTQDENKKFIIFNKKKIYFLTFLASVLETSFNINL